MKKIGLLINPYAGIGGRVGLKGSDGEEVRDRALALGAKQEAPDRARRALEPLRGKDFLLLTFPGEMGFAVAQGFACKPLDLQIAGRSTRMHTLEAVRMLIREEVDLILFAGGDGTARDVLEALGDASIPVIGIPAGVKIHSAVYAKSPRMAGEAAAAFLDSGANVALEEREVMDIDEELFRRDRVSARLFGYMKVPVNQRFMQGIKTPNRSEASDLMDICGDVIAGMESDTYYIVGPGTSTRGIFTLLGIDKTLLGVDVLFNKVLVAADVTEQRLFEIISGKRAKIVVTVIGGQGHLFGRGNQQISPRVIREVGIENIIIVATQSKIFDLDEQVLQVDTGDEALDCTLAGYLPVHTGFRKKMLVKVVSE